MVKTKGAPPILEPILVGIGMFAGGTIWILTHGQMTPKLQPSRGSQRGFSEGFGVCFSSGNCAIYLHPGAEHAEILGC